jgi:putative membrane protein (TIGR04086 family)
MDPRRATPIAWPQVAIGTLLAFAVAAIAEGVVALTLLGVIAGAFAAARLASRAGALHGAITAGLWIVASTLLMADRQPADLIELIGYDVAHLAAGAAGGWLAVRG